MDVASPLLRRACAVLDATGVRWAVLRGAEGLGAPAARVEVDLLVGPQDLCRLPGLLAPLGFRPFAWRDVGGSRLWRAGNDSSAIGMPLTARRRNLLA